MQPGDLRVALFSGNYNYVRDGANQALNKLVGHLLARGVTVRVYSPTTDTPAFPPVGDLVSVPAVPMPGGRDEFKLARGLTQKVRRDLEAFAPNIVHLSAPDILGHRALTWARRHNIASFISMHTRFETYPQYYHIGFVVPLMLRLLRRFYNRADQIVVPAPSSGELLRSWGVTKPIAIWSRGVDHHRFRPEARSLEWRRSLGIQDDEVAIGFLGRLVLEKGLDIFADVVAALKARGVRHRVMVIGEGPARDWFAERVPEAVFTGFQSGDALGRAVASMDVFFNPSVTETFGNVTAEAMAAGVPVVAARATGAVDLVEDGVTGFLVPPRDVDAYADAIGRLAQDDALRRSAGLAGHAAAERYEWDPVNEAVIDEYLAMMARRGA
ncbi:glycosyltransferase family 1 protein [Sphingomonas sp.]|jgi:glycosyltransferase involved in cell wall biosynthesis|uniref:glycosyltransferase family 4 protein n=1 Tax=Sphingomonas sp. TaxID=28214 RepID=UPI002E369F29|nr:glycosyltransferase family 1 protein [Sphingomonas sp.]HEX4693902.1 glycosyltransferase family 1 protein [Sphingomonas sp.]